MVVFKEAWGDNKSTTWTGSIFLWYLQVPYLRLPLCLGYFSTEEMRKYCTSSNPLFYSACFRVRLKVRVFQFVCFCHLLVRAPFMLRGRWKIPFLLGSGACSITGPVAGCSPGTFQLWVCVKHDLFNCSKLPRKCPTAIIGCVWQSKSLVFKQTIPNLIWRMESCCKTQLPTEEGFFFGSIRQWSLNLGVFYQADSMGRWDGLLFLWWIGKRPKLQLLLRCHSWCLQRIQSS